MLLCTDLGWKRVLGVAVGGVQVQDIRVMETLHKWWACEQRGRKAHVTRVHITTPIVQLKEKLHGAWAMVGIHEDHLDAWAAACGGDARVWACVRQVHTVHYSGLQHR